MLMLHKLMYTLNRKLTILFINFELKNMYTFPYLRWKPALLIVQGFQLKGGCSRFCASILPITNVDFKCKQKFYISETFSEISSGIYELVYNIL